MKVLFIGHHHENSGWGEASRSYLKALTTTSLDVVSRPVVLSGGGRDNSLDYYDEKSIRGSDVVIQCVLPEYWQYDASYVNVGVAMWETFNVPHIWKEKIALMDGYICPNSLAQSQLMLCSKNKKYLLAACPEEIPEEIEPLDIPELDGKYIFYNICEVTPRKNLTSLISAYHRTFSLDDNTALLLKVSLPGKSPQETSQIVDKEINKIKKSLRIYSDVDMFQKEFLVTNTMSRENMLRLHKKCHCYVSSSHGEGINLPMRDARLIGNRTIGVEGTGEESYAEFSVRSQLSIPKYWDTMPGYCNGKDIWRDVNEIKLAETMQFIINENRLHERHVLGPKISYSFADAGASIENFLKGFV